MRRKEQRQGDERPVKMGDAKIGAAGGMKDQEASRRLLYPTMTETQMARRVHPRRVWGARKRYGSEKSLDPRYVRSQFRLGLVSMPHVGS
jgi:hypothetical protein